MVLGASAVALAPVTTAEARDPVMPEVEPILRLTKKHDRAVREHRRLRPQRSRRELSDWSIRHLRSATRRIERSSVAVPGNLQAIAACESGGDPGAVDASGTYRGKYQFDMSTWQSLGGSGDPAKAPEATQDKLAVKLYNQRGTAPWGRCANS
jgi:hypothetical protein